MSRFFLLLVCTLFLIAVCKTAAFETAKDHARSGSKSDANKNKSAKKQAPKQSTKQADKVQLEEEEATDEEETAVQVQNFHRFLIEHSASSEDLDFSPRGNVILNYESNKSGRVQYDEVEFDEVTLTKLSTLSKVGGFYTLRFTPMSFSETDPKPTGAPVVASIPACALLVSGFRELMTFHIDVYGSLISVDYWAPIMDCPVKADAIAETTVALQSSGKVSMGRGGSTPKNMHILAGMDGDKGEKKKGPDGKPIEEEKTFWQKYWLYISIGLGVMVMQAVIAPPPEGGK